jgi:hypothetical protein
LPTPVRFGGDLNQAQIDIGAKSTIEEQFLLTTITSLFQIGEVEKTEVHWFFEFIDEPTGEDDIGNMGLEKLDVRCGMVITISPQQRLQERW